MSEQDTADADDSPAQESAGGADETAETDDGEPEQSADAADGSGQETGTLADVVADVVSGDDETDGSALEDVDVDDELLARIEGATPEETARCVTLLRARVEALESQLDAREEEIDDLESRLKRKQADFQNYKKRQKERMEEEKQRATEDLIERLLDVRDNLARALDQDEDADIRGGVETTLRQFDEQLERENVDRIDPQPGEEVDPQRHEALATIAASQPEDTIAQVHRPGYEMAGKLLRPAQVAVSDGSEHGETGDSDAGDGESSDTDA